MPQSARRVKARPRLKRSVVPTRRRVTRRPVRAGTVAPWWRRTGTQKSGFRYVKSDGKPLTSTAALNRIRAMVIPPAWTDVHISPDPERKIQAYGWDQRGRKQYIYSVGHVERSDRKKWNRVLEYARVLPTLRARTNEDLRRVGLDRRKVLATVVRLISRAFFRAGSERYAEENKTFGITTLRKRHVTVDGKHLIFTYVGKRGKKQRQFVADTPLAEVIEELLELPGEGLFRYRGVDGRTYNVTASTVNRYLHEILGYRYTAKDLRTYGATVRAATILLDLQPARSPREAKRNAALCCKLVAAELGNTPAICRKSYIHPTVLEEYERHGRTIDPLMRKAPRKLKAREPLSYYPEEAALMRFLEKYA